ncbi:unnamed protein product [Linum tenue]|uniref:Uncharacterized protein n=1 Tax=Linum tenue TaxID=586396 RepID=A0AAV0NX67_9ROSI|nr:unnamed protein product [Linum tenue]
MNPPILSSESSRTPSTTSSSAAPPLIASLSFRGLPTGSLHIDMTSAAWGLPSSSRSLRIP